ncbi:rRNA methyltransferase [Lampropedia cohaerens]|uniref:rRNA methyltransferase n=1 Tax=Lampropedia cohaerens TaxID=1610491 RepID=A0A0U1Q375_9BURK|nr:RNA methyltransferase [Lampropedia cohaerens]KKW69201.1 rRNA methyltransferase [Lampropedia cohaerens]
MPALPRFVPIHSRDNPQLKAWRRLAQDAQAYRKLGALWLEGEHLCSVVRDAGLPVQTVVLSQSRLAQPGWQQWLPAAGSHACVALDDTLFAQVSALESCAGLAYVLPWRGAGSVRASVPTVVLDRLQDAGNVGAILRSAAAFGFRQVVALQGTAALWSPKVVRAGMGAHFSLQLVEQAPLQALDALQLPLLLTSSHAGAWLHEAPLPWPSAWVLGHEGQGVSPALAALPHQAVRIAQPGGQESLNVATAAAICLHANATQALQQGLLQVDGGLHAPAF